jgi:hypothetical protein
VKEALDPRLRFGLMPTGGAIYNYNHPSLVANQW